VGGWAVLFIRLAGSSMFFSFGLFDLFPFGFVFENWGMR
jgi:hypothetical protein